ncbi:MAG: hypothetical protein EKK63_02645 [Acinetobacter sp.]|uniref:hypothetical protein n=1 Tax=Acinetobacter sp. TaxID=472 RepID=UPI000F949B12|nr:hypothetical protein [Acinetobacter sp.]RUP42216.1 MAG: hypothetical protein EKK63_02645 [Acinetobacter sp.]
MIEFSITSLKQHMEGIAAFSSGSILTLAYWTAFSPEIVVGKIIMSCLLGAAGGFGGLLAKAICTWVTRKLKAKKKS